MHFDIPAVYLSVSIVSTFIIAVYAWRQPKTRSARSFTAACLTAVLWMLGDVIGRTAETYQTQWLGELVRYIGVFFMPPAMIVFLSHYCGRAIKRKTIYLLLIVPVISWFVLLTDPRHHLFFSKTEFSLTSSLLVKYGTYFWLVHLPYSYGLLFIGFIIVIFQFSRASSYYRTQIIILFISLMIPLSVNVVGVFRLIGEMSYTPLSFPIFSMIIAVAIFRYRFLAGNPIAYETVFQNIRDGVVIVDRDNTIMDINPVAAKGLGKMPRQIIGMKLEKAFGNWKKVIGKYLREPDLYDEIEINVGGSQRYLSISITPLEAPDETLDGRIFTIRDITGRKRYELSLETLAFHDPLTRVANRRKFQEDVERAIENTKDEKGEFAILYFDLNNFKKVNDTMGHKTGDELLKYVAARVASILRKPDLLARLGGDEFAALLHDCDANGVEQVIKRLLDNVKRPFKVGEHTLIADLSIGTAFYPQDGESLDDLVRYADAEMYRAKQKKHRVALPPDKMKISENVSDFVS